MKLPAIAASGYLVLASCTFATAADWTTAQPGDGWIGIETIKDSVTVMLACRIPTKDGPAETYEIRLRTPNAPTATMSTIQISHLGDTLASIIVWPTQTGGYYLAPMNEDEAAGVFAAIRDLGGISLESRDWTDVEVAVSEDDIRQLEAFEAQCKGNT